MLRTHLTYGVLLCIPFCYEHFSITLKAVIISNACFCWIHIILCFFFLRKKKCLNKHYLIETWLKDPAFKDWLKVSSTNTTFKCMIWKEKNKERTLGDMGVGAIKKHMTTDGHKDKMKCYQDAIAVFQLRIPSTMMVWPSSSNLIAAHFNAT